MMEPLSPRGFPAGFQTSGTGDPLFFQRLPVCMVLSDLLCFGGRSLVFRVSGSPAGEDFYPSMDHTRPPTSGSGG